MKFEQRDDGSATLHFNDKEIEIMVKHKKIEFTAESLRHFQNNLMKIISSFHSKFPDSVKEMATADDQEIKVK
tara:strand:+ start:3098 stop:3316 length:219 start_codon:yes stop_codon:yes gene_type:complete